MNRSRLAASAAAAAAVIAAGTLFGPSPATGSSADHVALRGQPVDSRAEALRITRASAPNTLAMVSENSRQGFVDVGDPDFSPGDYIMLNLRLSDSTGETRIGRGTVRCDFGFGSQACYGTLLVYKQGQISVDGVIYQKRQRVVFAITGGTDAYRGASGLMRIVDSPDQSFLVLHFAR